MQSMAKWARHVAIAAVVLTALNTTARAHEDDDDDHRAGAVFTMNNAVAGNAVLVFQRAADGTLTAAGSVPTGGLGAGTGLGNQGAVVLSENRRWLFVVNAGSNDISVFRIKRGGLNLTDRVGSGGTQPVSVTVRDGLVYVLNAGAPNNISGFTLSHAGKLTALAGSTQPLSAASTGPAQVEFSPDGNVLVGAAFGWRDAVRVCL